MAPRTRGLRGGSPPTGSLRQRRLDRAVPGCQAPDEPCRSQALTLKIVGEAFARDACAKMITLIGWLILLVLCWPLALLALVLWPLVWLISLPFRLLGITFEALFAFLRAVLFLPARLLGARPAR